MRTKSQSFARRYVNVPNVGTAVGTLRVLTRRKRNGRNRGFASFLLLAIVLIQFFPIPKLPGLGVAPENVLFLIALGYLVMVRPRECVRSGKVSIAIVLMLCFAALEQLHNVVHGLNVSLPAEHIRIAIYLWLMAVVCRYFDRCVWFVKVLVVVGAMQVVFGALIHFVGEPFASLRAWMLRSGTDGETILITKGSQLAGLYGLPHQFSYLVASFPILAIALYYHERARVWLVLCLVLLTGLFLNAERSALGACVLMYAVWLIKTRQKAKSMIVIGVLGVSIIGVAKVIERIQPKEHEISVEAAYTHGTLSKRLGGTDVEEITGRLMWQVHGAISVLRNPVLGPSHMDYVQEVVGREKRKVVTEIEAAKIPPPHNHYVNVGVRAGIVGWVILAGWLWLQWRIYRTAVRRIGDDKKCLDFHLGLSLALLAAMLNALFHNAGIFSPELGTVSILGLYMACYRVHCGATAETSSGS